MRIRDQTKSFRFDIQFSSHMSRNYPPTEPYYPIRILPQRRFLGRKPTPPERCGVGLVDPAKAPPGDFSRLPGSSQSPTHSHEPAPLAIPNANADQSRGLSLPPYPIRFPQPPHPRPSRRSPKNGSRTYKSPAHGQQARCSRKNTDLQPEPRAPFALHAQASPSAPENPRRYAANQSAHLERAASQSCFL